MQRFLFYSLSLFLFLLTACGTPNPPGTPPPPYTPDVSGKLSDWTLGEASLRASFSTNTVAQGTLGVDGSFEFNFNNSVPVEALNATPSCEGLEVSDTKAKQNSFSALSVLVKGEKKGVIALASSLEVATKGLDTVGDFYVQYTYADRALSVKGDCPLSNPPATFSYDMTLKKGWNTVIFGLNQKNADGSQVLNMTTGAVPDEAAWFYRP